MSAGVLLGRLESDRGDKSLRKLWRFKRVALPSPLTTSAPASVAALLPSTESVVVIRLRGFWMAETEAVGAGLPPLTLSETVVVSKRYPASREGESPSGEVAKIVRLEPLMFSGRGSAVSEGDGM